MSHDDPTGQAHEDPAAPSHAAVPAEPALAPPATLTAGPLRGLIAALLAGGLTWAVVEAVDPLFEIPVDLRAIALNDPPERQEQQKLALAAAGLKNTMFAIGLLGLSLGFLLGVAEAGSRGAWSRAPLRGLLSGVLAGVAGCAAAWLGSLVRQQLQLNPEISPLARTILVHTTILSVLALGLGVGLSFPYRGRGLWTNAVVGCLLGGVLAALIYPAAVGFFFHRVNTDSLLPYPSSALLAWLVTAAVLIALVATSLGQRETRKPRPSAPAAQS